MEVIDYRAGELDELIILQVLPGIYAEEQGEVLSEYG
jgi:hypothetical protein